MISDLNMVQPIDKAVKLQAVHSKRPTFYYQWVKRFQQFHFKYNNNYNNDMNFDVFARVGFRLTGNWTILNVRWILNGRELVIAMTCAMCSGMWNIFDLNRVSSLKMLPRWTEYLLLSKWGTSVECGNAFEIEWFQTNTNEMFGIFLFFLSFSRTENDKVSLNRFCIWWYQEDNASRWEQQN